MAYRTFILCWVAGLLLVFLLSIKMWVLLAILSFSLGVIGFSLNGLVKLLNKGRMPVLAKGDFTEILKYVPGYCAISSRTRLTFLADVIYVPRKNGGMYFSIGDVMIWTARVFLAFALLQFVLMAMTALRT